MVMVNDPGFAAGDSSLFKGKTMTYYGRWTYKFEEAARQGAKGCLIVHTTEGASYPFTVVQNNWNASKLRLDDRGKSNVIYRYQWMAFAAGCKEIGCCCGTRFD
jgi:Zn-dependent M28 family amino/carboxypeptidase